MLYVRSQCDESIVHRWKRHFWAVAAQCDQGISVGLVISNQLSNVNCAQVHRDLFLCVAVLTEIHNDLLLSM